MAKRRRTRISRSQLLHPKNLILAAVALAVVGFASVGVFSESRVSQLAAAKVSVSSSAPKSCAEARLKAAAVQGKTDPQAKGSFVSGKSGTKLDKCYGAVRTAAAEAKKARNPNYRFQPTEEDYKCVGRRYTANVSTKGVEVQDSITDPGQDEGKCDEAKVVAKDPNKGPQQGQGGDGKGQGEGKGGMPELPKPPQKEQKPEQKPEQPQQKPEQQPEQARQPLYCGIPGASLFSSSCKNEQTSGALPEQSTAADELAAIGGENTGSNSPAPAPVAPSSAEPAVNSELSENAQTLSAQQKAGTQSQQPQQQGYVPQQVSGFSAPAPSPAVTQEEQGTLSRMLEGLRSGLQGLIGFLTFR